MAKINIKTSESISPMIYAYSTPEIASHDGWVKIGYTDKQSVEDRIAQQAHTIDVKTHLEWKGGAMYDDGSMEYFHDTDFHAYLTKLGFERTAGTEWFHLDGPTSRSHFNDFRSNRGVIKAGETKVYNLRDSQKSAVEMTLAYFNGKEHVEFLWNAKPRFGKTLTVYDFCKQLPTKYPQKKILIVTNRPAIANSWYEDYVKFLGDDSGFKFISEVDALKYKAHCLSRKAFIDANLAGKYGIIEFVSLQDLKGSIHFGGKFDKLEEVANLEWDLLVIDEAHEGVDTYKTDIAFDQIKRKYTLHLSGTPFKALANDKFPEDAIFNWTYADERRARAEWDYERGSNPYEDMPRLNLFTYQMSEVIHDQLVQGIEIQGETEEYAFDLNEFFSVRGGKFVHEAAVDDFLDAMTTQEKYPFSTPELRAELKHTFWLLNRVDSAKALAEKLMEHDIFGEYKIVVAAGDGRLSEDAEIKKSFDAVRYAIDNNEKTITLSVGQLTTGVTIPEWTAVMMLSNIKSPSLYMQAAFRAQNPYVFRDASGKPRRKENAYVFDFDPARTLTIYEKFANDLSSDTASGGGDIDTRKRHIRELLNFFPVIGEDDKGEMVELDAEQVLSIPRKIRSQEVVRRGFMSDFLFQNIANVFRAPQEVLDILNQFQPVKEPDVKVNVTPETKNQLSVDENGNIQLSNEYVIGKTTDVFGDKIFGEVAEDTQTAIEEAAQTSSPNDDILEKMKEVFHVKAVEVVMGKAEENYGSEIKTATKKKLGKKLKGEADVAVGKVYSRYSIEKNKLENELKGVLQDNHSETERKAAEKKFSESLATIESEMKQEIASLVPEFVKKAGEEIVRTVETQKKEEEKNTIEGRIKDHLRGFSRTIPSFLMAYGNDQVLLENFDTVIPDDVFLEVTSITLDQFRFLRDGGPYTDPETGKEELFAGHLFDPVVFDDSVKEFLRLRAELADYFDVKTNGDIFDYIPPQKTNQIFTPKDVVKKMVDMLEQEQPGCFDDPNKTFIDLYMKSGLYVAEIVKRLYQSPKMQELFPSAEERLKHIFKKQVYGLAPTEIIYQIALHFILGFNEHIDITEHNLRQFDALPFAKDGTLEQKLDELFGE